MVRFLCVGQSDYLGFGLTTRNLMIRFILHAVAAKLPPVETCGAFSGTRMGGAVASFSSNGAARVCALTRDIVLRSCARHSTHTVPLFNQVYKWVSAYLILG